jgi:hypothetical protein
MTTREQFFTEVLKAGGYPVTQGSLLALVTVAYGETGGSQGAALGAKNNPIDTILFMAGATAYNSFGPNGRYHVWNYPNEITGINATLSTFRGWPAVVSALSNSAPAANILAAYDLADGVGGSYYSRLLPQVEASYATLAAIQVAGTLPSPAAQKETDLYIILDPVDKTTQWLYGGTPGPIHLDGPSSQAWQAAGVPLIKTIPESFFKQIGAVMSLSTAEASALKSSGQLPAPEPETTAEAETPAVEATEVPVEAPAPADPTPAVPAPTEAVQP